MPNSAQVTYNASYHNIQTDKQPKSNSKKGEMKALLLKRNIPFCGNIVTCMSVSVYDVSIGN
jgi:hypothetical protein